jgi:uncharacterized protein
VSRFRTALAVVALLVAAPAAAGQIEMPRSEQFELAPAEGAPYRIFVAQPTGEAPAEGYPVIYVLDANSVFATMVEATRLQARALGPVLLVGIGYPTDAPFDERRYFDFTPQTPPERAMVGPPERGRPAQTPPRKTGGNETFVKFIEQTLKPAIEKKYKVNKSRQALFGHSLGGLFVLHVLFNHPEAFQTYLAGSPSIWWNDRSLLEEERKFTSVPPSERKRVSLLLQVGGDEMAYMIQEARDMTKRLAPMRVFYREIDGQSHVSMLPAAINNALQFVLKPLP